MAFLASRLTAVFRSSDPVVDHTGLGGEFDFHLECPAPRLRVPMAFRAQVGPDAGAGMPSDPDTSLDNLSKVLEKQLGLKLNRTKTKLDYLVVDHVNKVPTED
jgi:uncharacterized protein (TIGR03435 family)